MKFADYLIWKSESILNEIEEEKDDWLDVYRETGDVNGRDRRFN